MKCPGRGVENELWAQKKSEARARPPPRLLRLAFCFAAFAGLAADAEAGPGMESRRAVLGLASRLGTAGLSPSREERLSAEPLGLELGGVRTSGGAGGSPMVITRLRFNEKRTPFLSVLGCGVAVAVDGGPAGLPLGVDGSSAGAGAGPASGLAGAPEG